MTCRLIWWAPTRTAAVSFLEWGTQVLEFDACLIFFHLLLQGLPGPHDSHVSWRNYHHPLLTNDRKA